MVRAGCSCGPCGHRPLPDLQGPPPSPAHPPPGVDVGDVHEGVVFLQRLVLVKNLHLEGEGGHHGHRQGPGEKDLVERRPSPGCTEQSPREL